LRHPEPARQKFSAVSWLAPVPLISAAASACGNSLSAGPTSLAYAGPSDGSPIAASWMVHTLFDFLHQLYGGPVIPFEPISSFGCAICDPALPLGMQWALRAFGRWLAAGLLRKPFRAAPSRALLETNFMKLTRAPVS
jgi:hypothetical protein